MKRKNKEDLAIFSEAKQRNIKFKQKLSDFNTRANYVMKRSKKLVLYNQLRYDTYETFRELSVYLKKRSGIYNKAFYMVRKKNE